MSKTLQAIRGMNDILPSDIKLWQFVEKTLSQILARYDYHEIRFPIVENTDLFTRSIGEVTDIVEKEMYTFDDRNGDSLTLRPEGTACCVRAGIQNGLFYNQQQRLWYLGPMFRHERPQKGRYRQFYQIGVEAYGIATPDIDAELIALSARFWKELGLEEDIQLELNSLGTLEARQNYREVLVAYLKERESELDADSKKRMTANPLRVLDSKNPDMQALIADAPSILDHLDDESQRDLDTLCNLLSAVNIDFILNPRQVRGLDYYTKAVFEWTTKSLGAQNTVCAGGRYDLLVSQLGGQATPACGFAVGLERLILLLQQKECRMPEPLQIYLIAVGDESQQMGLKLSEKLRDTFPSLTLKLNCGGGSFKSQFKRADKSGADLALVLADDEIKNKLITLKYLREEKQQAQFNQADLFGAIKNYYKI